MNREQPSEKEQGEGGMGVEPGWEVRQRSSTPYQVIIDEGASDEN